MDEFDLLNDLNKYTQGTCTKKLNASFISSGDMDGTHVNVMSNNFNPSFISSSDTDGMRVNIMFSNFNPSFFSSKVTRMIRTFKFSLIILITALLVVKTRMVCMLVLSLISVW